MSISKKGGYSGGRPASEMGPPKVTASDVKRPVRPSPLEDLAYAVADARHWREASDRLDEQLTLALRREAHANALAEDGLRLAALARYHAQHDGIAKRDRDLIRELCDRLQGRPGAESCNCRGPFSEHIHPHGLKCLDSPCPACRREVDADPFPAPDGWCGRCGEAHAPTDQHSVCFCGTPFTEHPPGPPCPPPPPPGVSHG